MVIAKVRGGKAGVSLLVSMPRRYALPRVTSFDAASVFAGVTWLRLPTSSFGPNFEAVRQRCCCAWAAPAPSSAATMDAASHLARRWDAIFMVLSSGWPARTLASENIPGRFYVTATGKPPAVGQRLRAAGR